MPRLRSRCHHLAVAVAAATLTLSFSSGVALAQARGGKKDDPVKVATDHFKTGTNYFQSHNYSAALEQFQKSYQVVPSPNSGLYIARCYDQLGNSKEAYRQFRKVIAEASARVSTEPKYQPTLDSAKKEIEDVANKIAVLTVQVRGVGSDASLRVGGAAIPREQWGQPMPLDPGAVEVVVESDGKTGRQRVDLRRGERKTIDISPGGTGGPIATPGPVTHPRGNGDSGGTDVLLPLAITFGAVGVVGMGMFAVGGGLSLSTYSEVQDKGCPNGAGCSQDLIDRGEREQLIANIGVVIGSVGLAAGATFLIVDLATAGGSSSDATAPVHVAVGPGFVGVNGKF